VLSVYTSSILQNLIQLTQDYRNDLLAVQEVRWLGKSIIDKMYCTIYYSCDDKQHFFEWALLLVNILDQNYLILSLLIGECMCLELGKFKNYSLICAHAPTEEKRERENDRFYEGLDRT
jgi:hypothetical protein